MKRKVLSLVLALVLTLGVSVPAFANAPTSLTSPNGQVTITNVLFRDGNYVVVGEGAVLTTTDEYGLWFLTASDVVVGNGTASMSNAVETGVLEVFPGDEVVMSTRWPYSYIDGGERWYIIVVDSATVASGTGDTTDTAPTASDTPTTTAAPSPSNYVSTVDVNVRSGAGLSNDVIGGYKKGSPVNVIEQASRWWYKVQYTDSTVGYVSTLFVTGFDPVFYAAQNPDVVAVLGSTFDDLYGHYVRHGKAEGRAPYAGWTP